MPVQLLVACSEVEDKSCSCRKRDGNLLVDGFPRVMVNLNFSMIDGIGQVFKDDTAAIQLTLQGGPFSLTGVKRYRFDGGYASADSAQLIVDGVYSGKVQGVAAISAQTKYPNVLAVQVNVTIPDSDAACPVGWTPVVWSPTGPLAAGPPPSWKCVACLSGNYAELGALSCSACTLGTYAGAFGSVSCNVCPPGYSCPAGTALPAICFPGWARDPKATACELCPEGTYQPANASSSCFSCEEFLPGSTSQRGAALATECHAAPATECDCPLATTTTRTTSTIFLAAGPGAVNLGNAGTYAILSKAGISTVPTSAITGDIGVSPIAATAITFFSLTADSANGFATSTQVAGRVHAADYATPTPSDLTKAIGDMEVAYTTAAGRTTPDEVELFGGLLGGKTLGPGLYKFSTSVKILTDLIISGSRTDTWIFQMSGDLILAANKQVTLVGGALASNIVWQVAGYVEVGVGAHMEGILLTKTAAQFLTGSSLTGRILAQTAVTLQSTTVTQP
ncbi:unnamed protein product [Polarella glacialis]|uniref:Tyrosine-protein kinase ephrin type A/B receptor-like domain-containing protein n=1 Tax=Polarella glacialis TaxID=89957 RepID=A0A813GIY1_POLGL|nr:unnamed protein product [Polarella glacialis]CAE8720451.1 unnamed protein product [Polarella glacialis]